MFPMLVWPTEIFRCVHFSRLVGHFSRQFFEPMETSFDGTYLYVVDLSIGFKVGSLERGRKNIPFQKGIYPQIFSSLKNIEKAMEFPVHTLIDIVNHYVSQCVLACPCSCSLYSGLCVGLGIADEEDVFPTAAAGATRLLLSLSSASPPSQACFLLPLLLPKLQL